MSAETRTIIDMAGRAAVSLSDSLPGGWGMGMRAVGGILGGVGRLLERLSPEEALALIRQLADQDLPSARETAADQDDEIERMIRERWG